MSGEFRTDAYDNSRGEYSPRVNFCWGKFYHGEDFVENISWGWFLHWGNLPVISLLAPYYQTSTRIRGLERKNRSDIRLGVIVVSCRSCVSNERALFHALWPTKSNPNSTKPTWTTWTASYWHKTNRKIISKALNNSSRRYKPKMKSKTVNRSLSEGNPKFAT